MPWRLDDEAYDRPQTDVFVCSSCRRTLATGSYLVHEFSGERWQVISVAEGLRPRRTRHPSGGAWYGPPSRRRGPAPRLRIRPGDVIRCWCNVDNEVDALVT